MLSNGGILFLGSNGDREGLPPGPYDVTIEVESYVFKNPQPRIVVQEAKTAHIMLDVKPEARKIELNDNFDSITADLIDASTLDGKGMMAWLAGAVRPVPRLLRRVCALNILSRLAAPPMPKVARGLTTLFKSIHFADVDRIYAAADPDLNALLKSFVKDKGWVADSGPIHQIHKRLVRNAIKRFPELQGKTDDDFKMQSYRQGGRTALQIVLAIPNFAHPVVYADVDIDLGNPFWDVEGFLIHLGELLDGGSTDHFRVREKLGNSLSSDFIFFKVKNS